MREIVEVIEEGREGPATLRLSPMAPSKCYGLLNKFFNMLNLSQLSAAKSDPEAMAKIATMSLMEKLSESELNELVKTLLGGSRLIYKESASDVTMKVLDMVFIDNPGAILVFLAHALVVNYEPFSGALERAGAPMKALFPAIEKTTELT